MQDFERTHIDCVCDDPNHLVTFVYDPENGEVSVNTFVNDYHPWYKRIWLGIKYMFGADKLDYDCSLVKTSDYDKLINILNKAKSFTHGTN